MKSKDDVEQLKLRTAGLGARELLEAAASEFGESIALATSFGAEDQVLTHMICELGKATKIFTLDTGRLHQETYNVMAQTRERYGIKIEVLAPDTKRLEEFVSEYGPNVFYDSVEMRKKCCGIRKVEPLRRKLKSLAAWVCGLRREQAVSRAKLEQVEWDEANGLIKINPLAEWTGEMVWKFIHENHVPYNVLHDRGYPSIGCEPCTRALRDGEDIRGGRWWWEHPATKECGLHLKQPEAKH